MFYREKLLDVPIVYYQSDSQVVIEQIDHAGAYQGVRPSRSEAAVMNMPAILTDGDNLIFSIQILFGSGEWRMRSLDPVLQAIKWHAPTQNLLSQIPHIGGIKRLQL